MGGIAVPAQLGNALVTLQQHQLVVVAGSICPLNQRAIGHFRGQLGREGLVRGEGRFHGSRHVVDLPATGLRRIESGRNLDLCTHAEAVSRHFQRDLGRPVVEAALRHAGVVVVIRCAVFVDGVLAGGSGLVGRMGAGT